MHSTSFNNQTTSIEIDHVENMRLCFTVKRESWQRFTVKCHQAGPRALGGSTLKYHNPHLVRHPFGQEDSALVADCARR